MKHYIVGFSMPKRDIGAQIDEMTRPLIYHLIKLYLYQDSTSKNHWRKEVAEKFNHVPKLKGKNKYPSKDFILKNSWGSYENEVEYFVSGVMRDYGSSEVDIRQLKECIFNYLEDLAQLLEKHGTVYYSDIYDLLDKHGF